MEMQTVTVGERGQVVIPQKFREEIGFRPHEKVMAIKMDSFVVYKKMDEFLTESLIRTLEGGLGDFKFEDIENQRSKIDQEMLK